MKNVYGYEISAEDLAFELEASGETELPATTSTWLADTNLKQWIAEMPARFEAMFGAKIREIEAREARKANQ